MIHVKHLAIWALVLAIAGCASQPWDRTDKVLGATALAASVSDWGQTRWIAEHPEGFHEMNPMLGTHPSVSEVNQHFALSIAAGGLIANALPAHERKLFLGGVTVIELGFSAHNHAIGIGWSY